jgi:uroporphyrinogen-III synthase
MNTQTVNKLGLILNTRPASYHDRFHEAFGDLPWAIFDCPLTFARPIRVSIPSPHGFDTIIFTSQVGVRMFFMPDPAWFKKRVLAVGAATAEAAAQAGYQDVLQTGESAEDLRHYLANNQWGEAFYPSAAEISADLPQEFLGRITRAALYKMEPREDLPPQLVSQLLKMRAVAPIFSHRNAVILADLLAKTGITKANSMIIAVGISPDVFADVSGPWQDQVAAPRPTMNQMVTVTDMVISRMSI